MEPKAVVFECGPNCSCNRKCVNRTSQQGLQYRLEVGNSLFSLVVSLFISLPYQKLSHVELCAQIRSVADNVGMLALVGVLYFYFAVVKFHW